jgi:membrane-associated protease RseP (regulator of RpoE activity)
MATPPYEVQRARFLRRQERDLRFRGGDGNVVPMRAAETAPTAIMDGGAAPAVPPSIHSVPFTAPTIAGGGMRPSGQPQPATQRPAAAEPAKPPGPGWSGIVLQEDCDDWPAFSQLMMIFDDGLAFVHVTPFSPAAGAGLKSGDFVKNVDGIPLAKFNESPPLAGTSVIVEAHRKGLGDLKFEVVLAETPAIKPKSRAKPPRQPMPGAVACGARVTPTERPRWLNQCTGHPGLQPVDKALAARIVSKYVNKSGKCWPGHTLLASDMGVSVSTIQRSIARLNRSGLVAVACGRGRGTSNTYEITWPGQAGSKISYIRSKEVGHP